MNTMPDTAISVNNLVVDYGRSQDAVRAVDGLSFTVQQQECVGFIGANGAGKSTTIKVLMGFMRPQSGTATVNGRPAGDPAGRIQVGYLPEVTLYYPFLKARELLKLYGTLGGLNRKQLQERIPDLLEQVGLGGKENELLGRFSKGMRQRLGIAQALITEPDLLVLDEVSSGLDPLGRHDLRQLLLKLKNEGRTIFFSSHELTEVETLCDRVLILDQGKLIRELDRDALAEVIQNGNLESLYVDLVRSQREAHTA